MRRLVILVAVVTIYPVMANAGCEAKSMMQIIHVLRQGVDLNERFRRSANSDDEAAYKALRMQNERYSEQTALPCVRRAIYLLDQQFDEALLRGLMGYAFSRQNSADETVSEALASVFAKHPDAVASTLLSFPTGRAKVLLRTIEYGWHGVRSGLEVALRQDRDDRLRALRAELSKRNTASRG